MPVVNVVFMWWTLKKFGWCVASANFFWHWALSCEWNVFSPPCKLVLFYAENFFCALFEILVCQDYSFLLSSITVVFQQRSVRSELKCFQCGTRWRALRKNALSGKSDVNRRNATRKGRSWRLRRSTRDKVNTRLSWFLLHALSHYWVIS